MRYAVTHGIRPALVVILFTMAMTGPHPVFSTETTDVASVEGAMAAYDELAAVLEAKDLERYKSLMSFSLTQRMTQDWMFAEGLRSGQEYLVKVPKTAPAIDNGKAVFSKTYDEEKATATYSIEFLHEEGRWMFNGYRTTTKAKESTDLDP